MPASGPSFTSLPTSPSPSLDMPPELPQRPEATRDILSRPQQDWDIEHPTPSHSWCRGMVSKAGSGEGTGRGQENGRSERNFFKNSNL